MPQTTVVQLGTIDLKALCGCGSDCPDCCGVAKCGCPSVPLTIHATFSNSGLVPELDGQTFALNYNVGPGTWTGNLPCNVPTPGGSTGISLVCIGGSCTSLQLNFCGAGMLATAAPGCSCSPLNLVYAITTDGTCGCYPTGVAFTITVTA